MSAELRDLRLAPLHWLMAEFLQDTDTKRRAAVGKPPRLGRIAQAQHNGDGTHFVAFDVRRFPRETVIACSHDVPALEAA